jgi:phosphoribosylanthranilate isomerase
MRGLIKLCGVTSAGDLAGILAAGPDAVGFMFWPGSRRFVRPEAVGAWALDVPGDVKKVGVFVDAAPGEAARAAEAAALDVLQLHGNEDPEAFRAIGLPIWKAIHLDRAAPAAGARVDAWLADRYSAESPGGTGRRPDWERVRVFAREASAPVILAGGLTPDSVAEAIRTVRPAGVDVSSGVEQAPGRKEIEKVKAFIENARRAFRETNA